MSEASARVRSIMTTELLTIEQNQKLALADDLMRDRRVRHVLAVDEDGALVGVLSQRDVYHGGLLKALGYGTHAKRAALDSLRVKDAMTSMPLTTTPDTEVREAARLVVEHKIGCLPVLDGERLVGVLTESDFARLVAGLKTA